jgi:hypothetical protein
LIRQATTVEDALRRLEGQINPKVLQERAEKVDGWVRTMQQRMVDGDYDDGRSALSKQEIERFIDELDPLTSDPDAEGDSVSYNSEDALISDNTLDPRCLPEEQYRRLLSFFAHHDPIEFPIHCIISYSVSYLSFFVGCF